MNERIATIKTLIEASAELTALGQNYTEIARRLNLPGSAPNPTPRQQVPRPITLLELFGVIGQADASAPATIVKDFGAIYDEIKAAVQANDRNAIGAWFMIVAGAMNEAARAAVQTFMAQTVDDPTWSATVATASAATAAGVSAVTASDVQEALN